MCLVLARYPTALHMQADVTCTQPELGAGAIKVVVVGAEQSGTPLMTANVKMPFSEPDD